MAPFRNRIEDFERLDWSILQSGAIALYHRQAVLDEHRALLAAMRYRVYELHAGGWSTAADAHEAIERALLFPDHYGRNLAALVDCLSDMKVPDEGGVAIVVRGFDAFVRREPDFAHAILEALESTSRHFLLFGRRFLALVQSDDPTLRLPAVGARPIVWNTHEMASATRASAMPM